MMAIMFRGIRSPIGKVIEDESKRFKYSIRSFTKQSDHISHGQPVTVYKSIIRISDMNLELEHVKGSPLDQALLQT